jgi:hypothetical protein
LIQRTLVLGDGKREVERYDKSEVRTEENESRSEGGTDLWCRFSRMSRLNMYR